MTKKQLLPGYETTIVNKTTCDASGYRQYNRHVAEFRNPGDPDIIKEHVIQEYRDEKDIIQEFYTIPNMRHSVRGMGFTNFPKDMIDAIKAGEGDAIFSRDLFGPSYSIARFLNRTFGEELRQKTLDGWKNTKFGWAIMFSISEIDDEIFGKDYSVNNAMEKTELIPFASEEEAESFRQEVIQECRTLAQKHYNWAKHIRPTLGDADAETIDASWKTAMEMDKRDASLKDYLIWTAFCAMKLNNDGEVDPEEPEEFNDGDCFFVCQVIL